MQKYHRLQRTRNCEVVIYKVAIQNNKHLIISSFYRPPNNDTTYTYVSNTYRNASIWIAGDLNLPNIDWEFYTSSSSLSNIFL